MRRLALIAVLFVAAAQAHTTSTGLATLQTDGEQVAYRLTLSPAEVGAGAAPLLRAAAGDGAAAQQVGQLLQQHLGLGVDGQACRIRRTRLQASNAGDAAGADRVVVAVDFACGGAPGSLSLRDSLSTPFGAHYRSIVSVTRPDGTHEERVLDAEHPQASFDFGHPAVSGFAGFLRLGAEHILSGADHLLFLAALLLGASGLRSLLITVTAFTAAHSLSLAAATLGWAQGASPVWVEPMIAASIVWVALENVLRRDRTATRRGALRRHAVTFGFGLVHGLAFSEALTELHLHGWPLARALLGFNLGVEAGQALLVLALAPALVWLARRHFGPGVTRVLSLLISMTGLFWLLQRTL
ncbi:MAG TPA: HupE/UreJ family protein [Burkholderiaceae bacterium]|nr:HupE/UreJ family protein [Burkholderiaceae bacterium]